MPMCFEQDIHEPTRWLRLDAFFSTGRFKAHLSIVVHTLTTIHGPLPSSGLQ
jgi:hypothetical protein